MAEEIPVKAIRTLGDITALGEFTPTDTIPVAHIPDIATLNGVSLVDFNTHLLDTSIHFTQAAISITESQISDLQSYSLTSHTHTESDITDLQSYLLNINSESITNLSDVSSSMTPTDGEVLTYDSTNGWQSESPGSGVTDHTLLSNIGTFTHSQIDTHLSNSSTHFTQAAISITESQISDLQSYSPVSHNHTGTYEPVFTKNTAFNDNYGTASGTVCEGNDSRLSDARTPLTHTHTESDITDLQSYLLNINSESITNLSDVFSSMTPTDGEVLTYDSTNGWQSESPGSGVTDHTLLSNIGTFTHSQIDTHLSDTPIHFTQAAISITESQISDLQSYSLTSHTHTESDITDLQSYLLNINSESITNLSDVSSSMTPSDGQVLTHDTTNGWQAENPLLPPNTPEIALARYRKIPLSTPRTIAWVGDSTTYHLFTFPIGGFSSVVGNSPNNVYSYRVFGYTDGPFYNVTQYDAGDNGQTLANFIAGNASPGKNISDIKAQNPDLIVLSYGINDIRLGLTTKDELKTRIISAVTLLQTEIPDADIILRIPNSLLFDSANTSSYIDEPVSLAKVQDYSDRLYAAYKELEGIFKNVYVLDTRTGDGKIFSQKSRPLSQIGTYMVDALHPAAQGYAAIVREIVLKIGEFGDNRYAKHARLVVPLLPEPNQITFENASSANPTDPHLIDPAVLEDKSKYNLIYKGAAVVTATDSYFIIGSQDGLSSNRYINCIQSGDIVAQYGIFDTVSGSQGENIEQGVAAFKLTSNQKFDNSNNFLLNNMPSGYPHTQYSPGPVNIFRERPSTQLNDYDENPVIIVPTDFTSKTITINIEQFKIIASIVAESVTPPTTGGTIDIAKNGTTLATLTFADNSTTPTYSGTFFTAHKRGTFFDEKDKLTITVNAGFVGGSDLSIDLKG